MKRRDFLKTVGLGFVGTVVIGEAIAASEYSDILGSSKYDAGRTKNALASVVTGLIGQKLFGDSAIDVEVEKRFWPNARITGETTPDSIKTYIDLALSSVTFDANGGNSGKLQGTVYKSEFNWKVKQTGENSYEVTRFGPKFNAYLTLNINNGRISGTYNRTGLHFDWDIDGSYDNTGNVNVEIDGPLNLGIRLIGRINRIQ